MGHYARHVIRRRSERTDKERPLSHANAALNICARTAALVILIVLTIGSVWPWTALLIFVDLVIAFVLVVNLVGSFLVLRQQRRLHSGT
jgi:hypothetical protein